MELGEASLAVPRELAPSSVIVAPLPARGRTIGSVVFATTRSERRHAEGDAALAEELARRAALAIDNARLYLEAQRAIRARDDVHRIVAHDLRSPLHGIRMVLDLVDPSAHPETEETKAREYLALARQAAGQMDRLIQDMLDVARIEAGSLAIECEPESASALVAEAVAFHRPLAAERSLEIVAGRIPSDLPRVRADRQRILQVYGNLIGNAIKFTPPGGRITLRAEADAGGVRFSVSDTGPGIRAEHLPHLFDRFWQVKRGGGGGAGLGLPIAKGIVEAHGGQIWVESAVGVGTTFHFTLPAVAVGASVARADARSG